MTNNSLAARLKAIRESKGLTKYRLAKLSGISQTYIYRLELGEIKNPRRDTLQDLARGLNITLAQLVGETAPIDTWRLVEQSLRAYIPVFNAIYEVGMVPVDYVVCTRERVPSETLRGYRIAGLSLTPEILEGDTIIVDTAIMPKSGDLVVMVSKELKDMARMVEIKRYYANGNGEEWIEGNESRCALDGNHSCPVHRTCIYGVICEYNRKLRS